MSEKRMFLSLDSPNLLNLGNSVSWEKSQTK